MRSEALYKNFENIPTRRGRGGVYPYVRWQDVADRMNEVFGTNWSSEVMFQDVVGANVIVRVKVSVYDHETKLVSTQEGFGGAPNDASTEAGTPFKSAYSKALKDACKKWGVGLYLDEDDDAGSNTSSAPSAPSPFPSGYIGKEVGVPPASPILMEDPGVFVPTPPTPMASPISSGGMPLPPGVAMSGSPKGEEVSGPQAPQIPPMPKVSKKPTAPPAPPVPPASKVPPMPTAPPVPSSKVGVIDTGEPSYISDVQRAALQSILNIQGADYVPLAKEAFEFNGLTIDPIPEPDKLSYQEAVYVIKYGNDKFRKR